MTISNTERASRSLPFPLEYPENEYFTAAPDAITQIAPNFFPEDPDEKIDIKFNLSLTEFVNLASAIDIGRDIGFGEQSPEIWYIWCRALLGEIAMSCEDIADCIETDETVQAALVQNLLTQEMINQITTVVNNSGFGNPNSINPYLTTIPDKNPPGFIDEEIKELANCDLNKLWAGIRSGIVLYLNDTSKDVLEDLAAIPNLIERLAIFIDVVPVMGDLAEGLAFQITELVPDILALYESHESESVLDELACDIFSAVCADCRYPTFQEVFNVYATGSLGTPSMSDLTLDVMANYLLDLITNPAAAAYHTINVWALFVLNAQSAFNGNNGTKAIVNWATIGEDSANDNWSQLCDGCDDDYMLFTWDFITQGQGEFYADLANTTSKSVFEVGKGWRAVPHGAGRRFNINMVFDPTWEVRAAAMKFVGVGGADRVWYRRPTWASTTGQQNASAGFSNANWSGAWEGYASVTGYNEAGFYASTGATDNLWLTKVSILFNRGHSPGSVVSTSDVTPYS